MTLRHPFDLHALPGHLLQYAGGPTPEADELEALWRLAGQAAVLVRFGTAPPPPLGRLRCALCKGTGLTSTLVSTVQRDGGVIVHATATGRVSCELCMGEGDHWYDEVHRQWLYLGIAEALDRANIFLNFGGPDTLSIANSLIDYDGRFPPFSTSVLVRLRKTDGSGSPHAALSLRLLRHTPTPIVYEGELNIFASLQVLGPDVVEYVPFYDEASRPDPYEFVNRPRAMRLARSNPTSWEGQTSLVKGLPPKHPSQA